MMVAPHGVVNPRTIDDGEMKIPRDERHGDEMHWRKKKSRAPKSPA
jgi:hypothetical protein